MSECQDKDKDSEEPEKIEGNTDVEKPNSTLLVAGVLKDYEELLEAFVSNHRRGGGKLTDYRYDDEHELALITFEDSSVAENFLKAGIIKILGHEMKVLLPPDEKTFYIYDVSAEENEIVEVLLESPKKGGGTFSEYNYDVNSGRVSVSFVDEKVAQGLLDTEFIVIKNKKIFFSKIPPEALLMLPMEEDNSDKAKDGDGLTFDNSSKANNNADIVDDNTDMANDNTDVSNENTDMSNENTDMANDNTDVSNENTDIANDNTDVSNENTDMVNDNTDVANENTDMVNDNTDMANENTDMVNDNTDVVNENTVIANDSTAECESFVDDKGNEESEIIDDQKSDLVSRTIYIKEVPHDMFEFLDTILEDEKIGGGSILELVQDDSDVRVTFVDPSVAGGFLNRGRVMFGRAEFEVVPPPERFLRTFSEVFEEENEDETDPIPAAKVRIRGIPEKIHKDILLMMLEREEVGGGAVVDIEFAPGNAEAIVQFENPQIAQNLLTAGSFKYKNTILEILPVTAEKTELCDSVVEISNIPESMNRNKLYLFFENKKRSGGGKIAELNLDEVKGKAIVKFSDPEVAKSLLEKKTVKYTDGTVLEIRLPTLLSHPPSGVTADENLHKAEVVGKVWVSGIPAGTKQQTLIMFLENKKRSGGGEIIESELDYDESAGTAAVTFKDSSVAKAMIEKGELSFSGSILKVQKPSAELSTTDADVVGKVWVSGIPAGTKQQTLIMFLENKKRSGGGEIVESELNYDESTGTAAVTFKDSSVAKAMIEKGELSFSGSILKVQKPPAELSTAASMAKTAGEKIDRQQNESRTVELRGCTKGLSKDNILLWFENKARSGGGDVEDFQYLSDDLAIIVFKKAEDAACVAAKGEHVFSKAKLSASLLDSWPDVGGPHAVSVTGFKSGTSRDTIEMYFESKNRSGGGDVEEFLFDENRQMAVITFCDPQIARRVMSKKQVLEGVNLSVETLKPARPPPLVRPSEVDPDKLLFTELNPSKTDAKDLKEFAERASMAKVKRITFSSQPGDALVQFFGRPDYYHAKTIVCSRPYRGKMISVQLVPITKCIQVHSIDKLSQDGLELYFENRKSGGGPLKTVKFVEGSYAIIEFDDREVLERVLSKKHSFDQQRLDVQLYCPCLGVFPPGFDGSSPVLPIPPDFKVDCPREILKFFLTPPEKKRIEHHLNKRKCFLTWPRSNKTQITLHCTVEPNDPNAFQVTQNWENECISFLEKEKAKVKFGEIGILNEIWKSFRDGVTEKINAANGQVIFYEFDDERHVLLFSGHAKAVAEFAEMANSIKSRLEEDLDRMKTEIKELVPVRTHVMHLCKVTNALSKFADKVKFEEAEQGFVLTGQPPSVRAVKLSLLEFANGLADKVIDFKPASDAFEKVLSKTSVKDYILGCFSDRKIAATYEVKRGDVKLFAADKQHLIKAEKLLMSEIVEKRFDLDGSMKDVLQKEEWRSYKSTLVKEFPFLELSDLKSAVVFAAKDCDMQEISRRIAEFFSGNAMYEQLVELSAGKLDVLVIHYRHLLEQLKESVKPAELKTCGSSGSEKTGISIKAKKPALKQAECKVLELVARVQSKDYPVDKQSAIKSLQSEKGQIILQGISFKHKVVIKPADEEDGGQRKIFSDPVTYATGQLNQHPGKVIKLVLGDITKNRTDTVVNAANSSLDHAGGVAGAIAKAGHSKLTEECKEYIKTRKEINPGEVFVSSAGGNLPHKSVIHTVGPEWKDGKSGEDRQLASAVTAALKEADKRVYKSVSMPFLSCGIFKFPKKKAASIIVKEVRDFLAHSNFVAEVHIVNGMQESLDIFRNAMNDLAGSFTLIPSLMASSSESFQTIVKPKRPDVSQRSRRQRGATRSTADRTKGSGADSFQTPEGLSVALIRGSIADAKVDAIFNSTEKDMNLSRTAVSKSLLFAAGSGLHTECQSSFPQGIGYGNVVKTGAHKIACKAIYHGACTRWDNGAGNSEQVIRKLVNSTLQMAVRDRMTSVAFPAVGTGIKLRTPSRVVADTMIDEVIKFSAKVQKTSLKEVQFVIYEKDQDALSAFEAVMQSVGRKARPSDGGNSDNDSYDIASSGDEPDADNDDKSGEYDDDDDDEEEEENEEQEGFDDDNDDADDIQSRPDSDDDDKSHDQRFERAGARSGGRYRGHGGHRKQMGSHGHHGHSASSVTVLDSTIGSSRFLVNCEDVTKASSVDAIVNGTNNKFNLKYGKLSRMILHAAGNKIQDECLQNRTPDGWSVSSGGRMPFKAIFHITAGEAKGWKSLIGKVLKEADDMKLSSIAIPPVGVGRGSLTIKEFAEGVFEAVDDFTKNQPQHLQSIRVSILDHKILEEFISEIEKIMKLQGKPFKKLLSKVSDFFSSVVDHLLADSDDDVSMPKQRQKSQTKRPKVVKTSKKVLSKFTLRIYGMDLATINNAIASVKAYCDEMKQEKELKSVEVKEAISKLTQDQEKKLRMLEKQCSVNISINRQKGHESILLCSDDGDLTHAVAEVYGILIGFVKKEKDSRELELFSKQAVWQYQESGTWKKYGIYATGTIERAHQKREKEVEYTDSNGVKHKINFKDKTDERSSGGKVPVSRVVPGSISLPSRWKPMSPEENCVVVKLDPNGEEYKKVEANLKKTSGNGVKNIIQIERIQNQSLYRQYMNRKLDMDRTNNLPGQAQAQENERRLWHGTSGTNVNNINNRNFNRSYCGQHGVAIGNGVYFATNASYSIGGYCAPDPSGHKHIYQARVLTGKFCKGQGGLKEAPLLQGSTTVTYDSVVDNPASPGMFVVFLDYQTYPEYHITFT